MPHSHGYRARTRDLFCKGFRKNGVTPLNRYLKTYKVGDYVDIKVDGAIHKGMPHKFYHGRTGVVFNVTKSSVGVVVNKLVNGRIIQKRVNIRVEHVHPSKCRVDFLARVQKNEAHKRDVRGKKAESVALKRIPRQPRAGTIVVPKKTDDNASGTTYLHPQP